MCIQTAEHLGDQVAAKAKASAIRRQQQRRDSPMLESSTGAGTGAASTATTKPTTKPSTTKTPTSTTASTTTTNTWTIYGKDYNLDAFVAQHPGGKESILLGRGRDCTALFESYHPFTNQHRAVLKKYAVPSATDKETESVELVQADPFYAILSARVADQLRADGLDPKFDRGATWGRMAYYIVVFTAWIITGHQYMTLPAITTTTQSTDTNTNTTPLMAVVTLLLRAPLGAFVFAVFSWFMGALGHDAGHFAVAASSSSMGGSTINVNVNVNEWAVWAMGCIENPILWQHQHTYAHHSFTNEVEHDPDLHHFVKFLRVHPKFPFDTKYENQTKFAYVVMSYAFVIVGTCLWIPITMLQTGSLYDMVEWHQPISSDNNNNNNNNKQAFGLKLHMVVYLLCIVVAPLYNYPSTLQAVLSIAIYMGSVGIIFAFFSQINHLTEAAIGSDKSNRQRPKVLTDLTPSGELDLTTSWAATQIETSNNFATQQHTATLWFYLSNGLNYQIEHHLFPGLNHCHLYRIAHVVEDTCMEFGVEYRNYHSWRQVLSAALAWLEKMSVDDTNTTATDSSSGSSGGNSCSDDGDSRSSDDTDAVMMAAAPEGTTAKKTN